MSFSLLCDVLACFKVLFNVSMCFWPIQTFQTASGHFLAVNMPLGNFLREIAQIDSMVFCVALLHQCLDYSTNLD